MRIKPLALSLAVVSSALAGTHFQPPPGASVVPDQLILRTVPGASVVSILGLANTQTINSTSPGIVLQQSFNHNNLNVIKVPAALREAIADLLAKLSGVFYVEDNYILHTTLAAPNDPGLSNQWAIQNNLQALSAWTLIPNQYLTSSTAGTNRVTVAELDTGIDCTHPDFANLNGSSDNSASGGQLLYAASQAPVTTTVSSPACAWQDDYGHGTHVAGILAAAGNNGIGVIGLGFPLQIAAFKVLDNTGSGDTATVSNAIMSAVDAGIPIISMSFGGPGYVQTVQDAINYAWEHNVLTVAAAGNDGSNEIFFPADAAHAIAVAATDSTNTRASFSNYGNAVSISAPGANIYSTLPTYTNSLGSQNYGYLSGTSMATPYVSALAGLLWMTTPSANAAAVQQRIQQSATSSIANGAWDPNYGYGVINAYDAIAASLRPSTMGSVTGQITDGNGQITTDASGHTTVNIGVPVQGAQVTLDGQKVTTDSTGTYRIPSVPGGTWSLVVTAPGYTTQNLSATVAAGADTSASVLMNAKYTEYTGVIADKGAAVPGAIVEAVSNNLIVATSVADSTGKYQLWAPAGTYNLVAAVMSHYSQTVSTQAGSGGPVTANLTVSALGNITGLVTNGSGKGVAGAQIVVTASNGTTFGATSNANGNYSTIGLATGSYSVSATATGFPTTTVNSVAVTPDSVTSQNIILGASPPGVVSLSPSSGSGSSVTFTAVFSDSAGVSDLSNVRMLINTAIKSGTACYVEYYPQTNSLYLLNDSGTAWVAPTLTPGKAGTASNSQCTLNGGASSVTASGSNLTLSAAVTFTSTVSGLDNIYLAAISSSGASSGWVQKGSWTPQSAGPPSPVSVSPSSGSGTTVRLSATFSDLNGTGDLSSVRMLINTAIKASGACYLQYYPQSNSLYLMTDSGSTWATPTLTPGKAATVSNSQCSLNGATTSVTTSNGTSLTLNVTISFSSSVTAKQNVYLAAIGSGGKSSAWVNEGTWTP